MRFGARILERLDQLGMTDQQFCNMTGLAPGTLNYWKNGQRGPYAVNVVNVARTLDVSCDWLLGVSNVQRRFGE